jgi:hypothetical protein
MRILGAVLAVVALSGPVVSHAQSVLPERFELRPEHVNGIGNSSLNTNGHFPMRGQSDTFRVFLGTNTENGSMPGALIMEFERSFQDGQGIDFAFVTHSEGWGERAGRVLVQFFLGFELQGALVVRVGPDRVVRIELPGRTMIANRVVITNVTADAAGIDESGTVTLDDAGAAFAVPITSID